LESSFEHTLNKPKYFLEESSFSWKKSLLDYLISTSNGENTEAEAVGIHRLRYHDYFADYPEQKTVSLLLVKFPAPKDEAQAAAISHLHPASREVITAHASRKDCR
jgi:hypothetical protein